MISGELIGGEQYFDGFAIDIKKSGMSAEFADFFKKFGGIYTKQKEQIKDKKDVYIGRRFFFFGKKTTRSKKSKKFCLKATYPRQFLSTNWRIEGEEGIIEGLELSK